MERCFITGCDKNTEWQLKWFVGNFRKHNPTQKLSIADFGMTKKMSKWAHENSDYYYVMNTVFNQGWFLKPSTILRCPFNFKCWIDTDCQILGDISGIWNLLVPDKLNMVEDRPWTKRNGPAIWHNSGVVGVIGEPLVLKDWSRMVENNPNKKIMLGNGDQEVLHAMIGGNDIKRIGWINYLPHKYNTLRLDFIDNIAVKNPLIIHHTGNKGKATIRNFINGA